MKNWIAIVLSAFFLFACNNENQPAKKELLVVDSTKKTDTAQVLVLPAPLQISTWLHQYNGNPEMNLLASPDRSASNYKTEASQALNLGITLTDLGYAVMYNQREPALKYLALTKTLVSDLKLENIADPYISRLEKNIPQPDSISNLILTVYDNVNKQLNESKREKTALFITSGSFLEGLCISLSSSETEKVKGFSQFLAQQKLMVNNLSDALTYITPDDETQDLYNTFFTLQHYYEPIKVTIKNNVPVPDYSGEQLLPLKKKAVQLRDEILNH